jgi:carbamoyl-phosphate synthase large subunit
MHLQNYGTVLASVADKDKEELLPLIRRFYNLGFNIEATKGTATMLKENGIRTHVVGKINEGSNEIEESIRHGHIAYIINTRDINSSGPVTDGFEIRRSATENNVTLFTSLDTVKVLLDVLEETTITISTIDA